MREGGARGKVHNPPHAHTLLASHGSPSACPVNLQVLAYQRGREDQNRAIAHERAGVIVDVIRHGALEGAGVLVVHKVLRTDLRRTIARALLEQGLLVVR